MLVSIQQVMPMVSRTFQNRVTGQTDVFKSKGFILSDGLNSFYAEATGKTAEALETTPIDADKIISVELSFRVREFEDKDHNKRYNTEITIQRMTTFG